MVNLLNLPTWAITAELVSKDGTLSIIASNFDGTYTSTVAMAQFDMEVLEQAGMIKVNIGQPAQFYNRPQLWDYLQSNVDKALLLSWRNSMVHSYGVIYAGKWKGSDALLYRYNDGEVQVADEIGRAHV